MAQKPAAHCANGHSRSLAAIGFFLVYVRVVEAHPLCWLHSPNPGQLFYVGCAAQGHNYRLVGLFAAANAVFSAIAPA